MLQVTVGQSVCQSPQLYELKQMLLSFFEAKRINAVMNGNNVNSYHVQIESSNLEIFGKKIGLHGHKLTQTNLDGIYHLQLKGGNVFLVIAAQEFMVIGLL